MSEENVMLAANIFNRSSQSRARRLRVCEKFYLNNKRKKPHLNVDNFLKEKPFKIGSQKKHHILLVEDSKNCAEVAKYLLSILGYSNIVVAHNAQQALELFSYDFDLIILDVCLPDISGTELCQQLIERSPNKYIPMIAYTALGSEIKTECKRVGFEDFLFKPAKLNDFRKITKKYLLKQGSKVCL
jgi:CheY-like chemotaxis protein